jgi:hypothetical protein
MWHQIIIFIIYNNAGIYKRHHKAHIPNAVSILPRKLIKPKQEHPKHKESKGKYRQRPFLRPKKQSRNRSASNLQHLNLQVELRKEDTPGYQLKRPGFMVHHEKNSQSHEQFMQWPFNLIYE